MLFKPMEALLSAFQPITPQQAIAMAKGAGVQDARRVIIDFAAAGLVKGYALVCETTIGNERTTIRGAAIPTDLWKRVQRDGLAESVWAGGTLRLEAVTADALPEVHITGVSFSEASLQRLVEHYGGSAPVTPKRAEPPQPVEPAAVPTASSPRRSAPAAIPVDAVTVTVNQAMGMLGLGRTKINELMNDGRLVKRKFDRRTMIEVESIRLFATAAKHD